MEVITVIAAAAALTAGCVLVVGGATAAVITRGVAPVIAVAVVRRPGARFCELGPESERDLGSSFSYWYWRVVRGDKTNTASSSVIAA